MRAQKRIKVDFDWVSQVIRKKVNYVRKAKSEIRFTARQNKAKKRGRHLPTATIFAKNDSETSQESANTRWVE